MSGTPYRARRDPSLQSGGTADANALVLAEPSPTGGRCPCEREAHDGTARTAASSGFLRVAFTRGGRTPPREWVDAATDAEAEVHVVDATPCSSDPGSDDEGGVVTVAASGPGNLTDLGVRITDRLEDMDARSDHLDGGGLGPVCCLGSLTALLQYVDTKRAYRFVNAVTTRVATYGGVTHAHIRPEAHDEQTVDTMASLFDMVAEPTTDGIGLDVIRSRRR